MKVAFSRRALVSLLGVSALFDGPMARAADQRATDFLDAYKLGCDVGQKLDAPYHPLRKRFKNVDVHFGRVGMHVFFYDVFIAGQYGNIILSRSTALINGVHESCEMEADAPPLAELIAALTVLSGEPPAVIDGARSSRSGQTIISTCHATGTAPRFVEIVGGWLKNGAPLGTMKMTARFLGPIESCAQGRSKPSKR